MHNVLVNITLWVHDLEWQQLVYASGFTHFQSYCETITEVDFIQFHLELGR